MKILFHSSDSLGVRSMAHSIETDDGIIIIDPGAALGPSRYGLPPHELELEELEKTLSVIQESVRESDLIIITHYHYDHYLHDDEHIDSYRGKHVIMKHPTVDINWSQRKRAHFFNKKISRLDTKVLFSNGGTYKLGKTLIEVSNPVWHGAPGTKLGKILMVYIKDEENSFLYASDAQGPLDQEALRWIISKKPDILYISGPPLYLQGSKLDESIIKTAEENLLSLLKTGYIKNVILDHHFSRLLGYEEKLQDYNKINSKVSVYDVAEYTGKKRRPLEALRKFLWGKQE